jgi:hypothetical protein
MIVTYLMTMLPCVPLVSPCYRTGNVRLCQLPQKIVHLCFAAVSVVAENGHTFCFLLPDVFGVCAVAVGAPDNAGVPVNAGVPLVGVSAVDYILLLLGPFCCWHPLYFLHGIFLSV